MTRVLLKSRKMKTLLVSLFAVALLNSPLYGQAPAKPAPLPDLKTVSGKVYKQARVFRVEPDGITYMFAGGMVKIDFTDLPEAIRKQYGYDLKAAAAFAAADARYQDAAYQGARAAEASDFQRKQSYNVAAASDVAAMPKSVGVGTLNTLQTGGIEGATSQAATSGPTATIKGQVLSISHEDGLILVDAEGKKGIIGAESVDGVVAVSGVSLKGGLADGDFADVTGVLKGTYEYTTAGGAAATVKEYSFKSGYFKDSSGRKIH